MNSLLLVLATLAAIVVTASEAAMSDPRICIINKSNNFHFPIHANLNGTVLDLKRTLQAGDQPFGVPPNKQVLTFNGKTLEDHKILGRDYNITKHSMVGFMSLESKAVEVDGIKVVRAPLVGEQMRARLLMNEPAKQGDDDDDSFYLTVWHQGSTSFALYVSKKDDIKAVKEKIFEQEEFPVKDQHLYYTGDELQDGDTVQGLGLNEISTLIMVAPHDFCYTPTVA